MLADILKAHDFEPSLIEEIAESGNLKVVSQGEVIIDSANKPNSIPFVLEGLLKVYRQEEGGKEVLLYYLEKGETCAMSITCCLEKKHSSVKVIAEEDAKVWQVPNALLDRWITKYPSFRRFVFTSYQMRFDELMHTIDSMVFTNMEERLYKYLLDTKQAKGSYEIVKTHQEIANELGTSRVVISRLLKKLEQNEQIQQFRNRIEIL